MCYLPTSPHISLLQESGVALALRVLLVVASLDHGAEIQPRYGQRAVTVVYTTTPRRRRPTPPPSATYAQHCRCLCCQAPTRDDNGNAVLTALLHCCQAPTPPPSHTRETPSRPTPPRLPPRSCKPAASSVSGGERRR